MPTITTDRRRIEAAPDIEAHERAVVLARGFVEQQVRLARELRRIHETTTFVALGCASIEEYGVRLGLTGRDARQLVALGHSLDAAPLAAWTAGESAPATVGDAVLAGEISVEKAALAGRLLASPGLLHDGENAVELAATMPTRRMKSLIREREEELAQQQPVTPIALAVTPRAKENFRRARAVASEQAGTMLTEGETFSVIVEHYLDSFDTLRRGEGSRRVPSTVELPAQRYIPAEVRRAVRERSGERCEVPGCPRDAFLEFAHVHHHREGGSREVDNLVRLCHRHHVLFDAGRIRFGGWAMGRPSFLDADGTLIEESPAFIRARPGARGDGFTAGGPEAPQVSERPPPEWNSRHEYESSTPDAIASAV